jgi:histidine ammonia-lyase
MSCHAARRLGEMTANLERIVAIEALAAAQGVEMRAPLTTSARLRRVLAVIRAAVPPLVEDRYVAADIEAAAALVRSDVLVEAAGRDLMPELA